MKTRRSFPQLIFEIVNTAIMLLLCIICIIPLWHVIMASISEPVQVDMATGFILRPLGVYLLKPTVLL